MQDLSTQPLRTVRREHQTNMTHTAPSAGLLFLREEELRVAQDMLFFAIRDLSECADGILAEYEYGRAHYRCLHWIARRPELTVGELLTILGITKQSLTRVLGPLIREGFVAQVPGQTDRRQRLLSLTEKGVVLERRLFEAQRERLAAAYREAGGAAVDGFRRVLRGLTTQQGRDYMDALDTHRAVKGHRPGS
jgi:DNA-binding MarR family transcriptional regulator